MPLSELSGIRNGSEPRNEEGTKWHSYLYGDMASVLALFILSTNAARITIIAKLCMPAGLNYHFGCRIRR